MDKYVLSYVNTPQGTTTYDREFDYIFALIGFVREKHPDRTSYQIIVVADRDGVAK